MASLMFKITNEEAADVRTIRAEIPEPLSAVINKAIDQGRGSNDSRRAPNLPLR